MVGPTNETTYSYQSSMGVQRQLAASMAIEADYGIGEPRRGLRAQHQSERHPATGLNYPFTDITAAPSLTGGVVEPYYPDGFTNYHALQMAFTKRYR